MRGKAKTPVAKTVKAKTEKRGAGEMTAEEAQALVALRATVALQSQAQWQRQENARRAKYAIERETAIQTLDVQLSAVNALLSNHPSKPRAEVILNQDGDPVGVRVMKNDHCLCALDYSGLSLRHKSHGLQAIPSVLDSTSQLRWREIEFTKRLTTLVDLGVFAEANNVINHSREVQKLEKEKRKFKTTPARAVTNVQVKELIRTLIKSQSYDAFVLMMTVRKSSPRGRKLSANLAGAAIRLGPEAQKRMNEALVQYPLLGNMVPPDALDRVVQEIANGASPGKLIKAMGFDRVLGNLKAGLAGLVMDHDLGIVSLVARKAKDGATLPEKLDRQRAFFKAALPLFRLYSIEPKLEKAAVWLLQALRHDLHVHDLTFAAASSVEGTRLADWIHATVNDNPEDPMPLDLRWKPDLDLSQAIGLSMSWQFREINREKNALFQNREETAAGPWRPATEVSEGIHIVPLSLDRELEAEGRILSHCVFTYREAVYEGSIGIFSLRTTKNGALVPKVTIEIGCRVDYEGVLKLFIRQARGKGNCIPSPAHTALINDWLNDPSAIWSIPWAAKHEAVQFRGAQMAALEDIQNGVAA